jgi:hypothetical protein
MIDRCVRESTMSKSESERTKELGDVFVAVTGDESVVEEQDESETGDREVPDTDFEVSDGLEEAVEGAEVTEAGDPGAIDD